MLLVEQNIYTKLELAERGYVFENGTVTLAGTVEELRNDDRIKKSFLDI